MRETHALTNSTKAIQIHHLIVNALLILLQVSPNKTLKQKGFKEASREVINNIETPSANFTTTRPHFIHPTTSILGKRKMLTRERHLSEPQLSKSGAEIALLLQTLQVVHGALSAASLITIQLPAVHSSKKPIPKKYGCSCTKTKYVTNASSQDITGLNVKIEIRNAHHVH